MASRLSRLSSHSAQIGFIGLGKMGFGMARNVCSPYKLLVYDLDNSQCERLQRENPGQIEIASSASEVAKSTDFLISVLPNDKVLTDLVHREIHQNQPRDSCHLSCSTISPETARSLCSLQWNHNETHYISAPLFARPDGMRKGQATIPISGGTESLRNELINPILSSTATAVYDFGDEVTSANVVKLCGNFLIAAAIESMSESFTLAESNGVDRVKMKEIMTETIFDCLIYKGYGQRVSEFDHTPYEDAHFALELGHKDVNLVMDTANRSHVPMPIASLLHQRYLSAMSKGRAKMDWSAIALNMAEDAGIDVAEKEKESQLKEL